MQARRKSAETKKRPTFRGAYSGQCLSFFHQTRFNSFNAYPLALDCAAGRANPYALDIGLKRALCLLDELQADAAAFLALTFVYNPATAYGALSRY